MPLTVQFGTDRDHTRPSPALWDRANIADALMNRRARYFWEDFDSFGLSAAVASNVGRYNGNQQWRSYEDTGDAIAQIPTNDLGVATITIAATNNNESWLQPGGVGSVFGTIKAKSSGMLPLFFEARVAFGQATTTHNWFVGMTEETMAAADALISDTGVVADKDYIGFHAAEADGTVLNFIYRKAGQAAQTLISGVHTITANSFVKLGFVIDPWDGDSRKRGKIFVNGIEQSTYLTDAMIAAATFPAGEELHALVGGKNNNASVNMSIDWLSMLQFRDGL